MSFHATVAALVLAGSPFHSGNQAEAERMAGAQVEAIIAGRVPHLMPTPGAMKGPWLGFCSYALNSGPFTSPLRTEHNAADSMQTLLCDLTAYIDCLCITAPAGTVTDLASTPWFAGMFYPHGGRYSRAAVIHDYLYGGGEVWDGERLFRPTRAHADRILYRLMRASGCRWYSCGIFYASVRLLGWRNWSN